MPSGRRIYATRNLPMRPYDLDGEAIEEDGTVLKAGDWLVYEPGTRHSTRTVTGCVLLGIDWDPPGRR